MEKLYTLAAQDGFTAGGPLLAGLDGALYGTLIQGGKLGGGTVFRLAPPHPPATTWTLAPIYSFPSDARLAAAQGTTPAGPLIQDADGSIIGTASNVVFMLRPPPSGGFPWKETVLRNVSPNHVGQLVAGQLGELYCLAGMNAPNGVELVRLTPPTFSGGSWTVATVYKDYSKGRLNISLTRPRSDGTDIYGVSNQPDSLFRLRSPTLGTSAWTKETLHQFAADDPAGNLPHNDLIADRALTIYGSTSLGGGGHFPWGGFYKLTAPSPGQTGWTERVIYKLKDYPDGVGQGDENSLLGVVEGSGSVLYGTNEDTGGGGFLFSLTPTNYGGNRTPWNRRTLYGFPSPGVGGSNPLTKLTAVQDGAGHVSYVGMTGSSDQAPHLGIIYRFTP